MRAVVFALAVALPAAAHAAEGWTIGGHGTAGYRLVDIDGAKSKYREDYNLRSGLRLFDLQLDGRADAPDTAPLDRFHVGVETPGDEPVSRFTLSAVDRRRWDLRADFRRSKYVYAVPQLWEGPVDGVVRLDDLHDWNTVRTHGAVDLAVHAPRLPTIRLGYRLHQRDGDGVSTMFVPGGDDFLVNRPVDDVAHTGLLGTEFRALGTDVFLQQEYRAVQRNIVRDGPRDPAGLDPDDAERLGSVRSVQEDHIAIPTTRVRLRRPVGERLDLRGAYLYSHARLDLDASRRMGGVVSTVVPPAFAQRGEGDATLSTHVVDLGGTFDVTERVRLVTDWRYHDRSQHGELDETSTFGRLAARTGHHVRRNAVTSEVEVEPRPNLTLRGGVGWHRRDANFSQSGVRRTTDAVDAVGGLTWRPSSLLSVSARYENVQVDDPFVVPGDAGRDPTLPEREIALTFVNRGSAGFRLTPRKWISLGYQLTADSRENDSFDARARVFGNTATLTLEPRPDLLLFASYTRRDLDYRADVLFPPAYRRTASRQDGTEDVVVAEARWDFALAGHAWSTGIDFAWVLAQNALRPRLEADGRTETFFDLQRADGGWFLAWRHRWVEPSVEVRRIEYTEPVLPANDYSATIVALKLTKRFGNR